MTISRSPRGSALLTSMIVILVITVIGVGMINFASQEVAGATASQRDQALVACADAARQMLLAQFHLIGFPASIQALNVPLGTQTGNGNTLAIGGHYDADTTTATGLGNIYIAQVSAMADNSFGSGAATASDITNRISTTGSLGGRPYKVVVHCQDGSLYGGRQLEVEFGIRYGL